MARKMFMILAVCVLCFGGYGCGEKASDTTDAQESTAPKMTPQEKRQMRHGGPRSAEQQGAEQAPAEGAGEPAK